ncbi:MAG: molybdopterin molybdotransferase MoeA [Pseudomonadales bacterium]|nr:molybdopterin molybdotransferase MoeA [Pseudomonadales bacterium]MCP5182814.1 molybdopterin molybdotransferase MoeA [Pseudomonadales bacterium]
MDSNQAIDLNAALARIASDVAPMVDTERVPLGAAQGRILAEALRATHPAPPFPSSAMDGYALPAPVSADLSGTRWRISGESAAGHPWTGAARDGECIRILTGAAVPDGFTRVVLQEDTRRDGDVILISGQPDPRSNIRPVGHDVQAGEPLMPQRQRLGALEIGRLASDGVREVSVYRRPRIGVFSTGDELVDAATTGADLPYGCIYESNRATLLALLKHLPVAVTDLGNLPDDAQTTRRELDVAARSHDLLLTSGGVSVGDHDHVRNVVEALGYVAFWKLNLKPGKPLAFGRVGNSWFCGLPGNPVSTIVTWLLIARPLVLHLCGQPGSEPVRLPATLATPAEHHAGRTEYQRGCFSWRPGQPLPVVSILGDQSSNRLATFQGANCLVEIPAAVHDLPAGAPVTLLPLAGLLD